jgi:hypothetical protein
MPAIPLTPVVVWAAPPLPPVAALLNVMVTVDPSNAVENHTTPTPPPPPPPPPEPTPDALTPEPPPPPPPFMNTCSILAPAGIVYVCDAPPACVIVVTTGVIAPPPVELIVTAPVAPEIVIPVPATIDVTPAFVTVTLPVPPAGEMLIPVPAVICDTPPPAPVALIVAYGLAMVPEIVMPGPAMALRTSAPFNELLMNLRNHVASHSVGIERTFAPLMPGFVGSGLVTLPLTRFDHRRHVYRERWRCVRHAKLHHQTVVLP